MRRRVANQFRSIAGRHKLIIENFSFITLMQMFTLLAPFLTYPYLVRVLGSELYGVVLTAQMLSSYATIVVRFGFDSACARHVSIYRDNANKLSELLSCIQIMRFVLWIVCFILYSIIILVVQAYREHILLFLLTYGMTLNVLLYPQFFFQGIEKMKYITIINIVIQFIFVTLTFMIIHEKSDYIYIPLLYSLGYFIGGVISIYIIYKQYNIRFIVPKYKACTYYFKDALPLFATDAVCTIKDKFNYLLLGLCTNMSNVVLYDIGSKLTNLVLQPLTIINIVIFPKMAKDKNDLQFKRVGSFLITIIVLLLVVVNLFLDFIMSFLTGQSVDTMPIRLFLLSPLFLGGSSYISTNLIIARGYHKYQFYSIVFTSSIYVLTLGVLFLTGKLDTVFSFIALTVISYFVEMLYRLHVAHRILHKNDLIPSSK